MTTVRHMPIRNLKMGYCIGSPSKALFILATMPVHHSDGSVEASIIFMPEDGHQFAAGEEPRVERRRWLHGDAELAVRYRESEPEQEPIPSAATEAVLATLPVKMPPKPRSRSRQKRGGKKRRR